MAESTDKSLSQRPRKAGMAESTDKPLSQRPREAGMAESKDKSLSQRPRKASMAASTQNVNKLNCRDMFGIQLLGDSDGCPIDCSHPVNHEGHIYNKK